VFAPDIVLYTSLVHAWCHAGQLDEVERVFDEMKQSGIMPNVYTYTCVIDLMYHAGQVLRAQDCWNRGSLRRLTSHTDGGRR
jgi:pentatricopeptide repeat protein